MQSPSCYAAAYKVDTIIKLMNAQNKPKHFTTHFDDIESVNNFYDGVFNGFQ